MDRIPKEIIPPKRNALEFVNKQISSAYNRIKDKPEHQNLLKSFLEISQKSILILGLSNQENLPLGSITPMIISDKKNQGSLLAIISPTGSQELYENPILNVKIPTDKEIVDWFKYVQLVYDNIPLQDRLIKPPSNLGKAIRIDDATYTAQKGEYKPISLQIVSPTSSINNQKIINSSLN